MSIVEVAVPMLRGKRRFYVEKGRRWSVIEHLMLEAVSRAPSTTADLSLKSKLHRRIVVEAFIRLMRVGWVEIIGGAGAPVFSATREGQAQIERGELKSVTVTEPRTMSFAVDQVTGQVFRGAEFSVQGRTKIAKAADSDGLVFMQPSVRHQAEDLSAIYSALEGDNEEIVGVDPAPYPPFEGFAVVRVVGGAIDEIAGRTNKLLRSAILAAAVTGAGTRAKTDSVPATPDLNSSLPTPGSTSVDALFEQRDLILGGDEHEKAFISALRHAQDQAIIHSTFISERIDAFLPHLISAAARGVRVSVFWGQSDDQTENSTSRRAAAALREAVQQAGRTEEIKIHTLSTDSHAKILACDDGRGAWSAIVGSCNWLSTDFVSFEASVRLRDPALAGEIVNHLAALSMGSRGVWHQTANDLTVLARKIRLLPVALGRKAKLRILLAPEHSSLLLEARDSAKRRILVTSHRIGVAGQPMVIVPALAAARTNNVAASLYFGRPTGALSGVDAANLAMEFKREGVNIQPIFQPRLHAKTLAWDDDALAVSSQNWLSASSSNDVRREIGIFIESNKIADTFIRRFEHARSQA